MTIEVRSAEQRRAEITAAIQQETGIDEALIERLVRGFYARVREDALIGPVFEARIKDCWKREVALLCHNEAATVAFLEKECTGEEFSWLSEVFEEVAGRTMSKRFVEALRKTAKKYPQITEEYGIDEVIEYAAANLEDLGDAW